MTFVVVGAIWIGDIYHLFFGGYVGVRKGDNRSVL